MWRTWDQNRAESADWLEHAEQTKTPEDPLAQFLLRVDLLLYAAVAGFLCCVIVILLS